ncbi:sulfotransferase [Shewanella olleyana]|uniref:sulfotransferase family protein n=1 Tax=Shewanella olleyana TaxID=135626 RepID=UPI00200E21BE|nr:sulfotransferase [Shewanella olleyana]MCL1067040.1 sulfotransferase [Shewanella olleyana]
MKLSDGLLKMNQPNIVFIGGTGRCGTNVIKDILSLNQDVGSLPFETRFTIDPDGLIDSLTGITQASSPFIADLKIKRLKSFLKQLSTKNSASLIDKSYYADWELSKHFHNYDELVDKLIKGVSHFTYTAKWPGALSNNSLMYHSTDASTIEFEFSEFINTLYSDFLYRNNKKIYVEDNTYNSLFIDKLLHLCPNAKFIHMVRDPRDVIASYIGQRWTPTDLADVIYFYKNLINSSIKNERKLNCDSFIRIKLEDLCKEPKHVLNKLSIFCGIDYVEEFSKFDLTRSNSGRWQTQFSTTEIEFITETLQDELTMLGYSQ